MARHRAPTAVHCLAGAPAVAADARNRANAGREERATADAVGALGAGIFGGAHEPRPRRIRA